MSTLSRTICGFRFQKLEVWQDARRLNLAIYRLVQRFPAAEQFSLTSQIRRASISIAANIAEGSGRNSDKDFAHFLELSYGSAMELASHLVLAGDLGYIEASHLKSTLEHINMLSMRIAALNRSLNIKTSKVSL